MCKFKSLQKDECGAKQADSSQACYQARAYFIIANFLWSENKCLLSVFKLMFVLIFADGCEHQMMM